MIDILRKLTIRFKKVIVISHIEEVKEAFEDKLLITKEVSWSKITIF
jgi:DNA repair exonuclease SbcCD ATPase subunit